jgi:hypothetical protein
MSLSVAVTKVAIRSVEEDERGNQLINLAVHFRIQSGLGVLEIEIPVDRAKGLDEGVEHARRLLRSWGSDVSRHP